MGNVRTRIAESLDEMRALDAEISARHAWWDGSYAISKHRTRFWRYYADKFDQRAGPEDDPRTLTLRAADEMIWSCWKTALKNLGTAPEFYAPAPIAYFAAQFSASTNHRADYPPDLDPDLHKLFADHVRELAGQFAADLYAIGLLGDGRVAVGELAGGAGQP